MKPTDKKTINVAVIGTGFIARAFAVAFDTVAETFQLNTNVCLFAVSSRTAARAADFAARYGVVKHYGDWRKMLEDPDVDAVLIGSEDWEHYEQALFAMEAGKHVLCEKPIAMSTDECVNLVAKARETRVANAVGFTYLANPAVFLMKELIEEGKLGEIYSFSAHHNQDYMSDPNALYTWRCDEKRAYLGALADLGYHLIALLLKLLGMPESLAAMRCRSVRQRRDMQGNMLPVTTDNIAHAIIKYAGGPSGIFQTANVASGRKLYLRLEIHGSKGALLLDQENLNQVSVHLRDKDARTEGYRRILIGPEHRFYKYFCPAAGHGLSFNNFVTIQAGEFISAILDPQHKPIADLEFGLGVQRVIESMVTSAEKSSWIQVKNGQRQGRDK